MSSELLALNIISAAGGASVTAICSIVLFKLKRKADTDDYYRSKNDKICDLSEKIDKLDGSIKTVNMSIETINKTTDKLIKSQRSILFDRISFLVSTYLDKGEITVDQRQRVHVLHDLYHNDFYGNGALDDSMDILDSIPVKK